jgi:diadenosine tetraphosphate (Ap4A) HIT family hydrolase
MPNVNDCCLCSQIRGDESNDLINRLLPVAPYVRRVSWESQHFAVIPSLGPLAPGHMLLCPKEHMKNMACLPGAYDNELYAAKRALSEKLSDLFGLPVHLFEHGSPKESARVVCTVDHAHLHFVPAEVEVWEEVRNEVRWLSVAPVPRALRSEAGSREYLYYESPDGRAYVTSSEDSMFESQYMRRAFARAIGNGSEWNWRDNLRAAEVHEAYVSVREAFAR